MVCQKDEIIAARAYYGHDFVCAVQKDNIYGVQFHPEKSHRWGDDVLGRFAHA
jgi:glutamine amidotransferase